MKNNFGKNSKNLCTYFPNKFNFNFNGFLPRSLSFQFNHFFIHLFYYIILSLFGYLGLKFSKPRSSVRQKDFDLFYTSVSASTVSSMTSIEMEVFSNSQLILLTFLMLVGGEVFTSMLQLFLNMFNFNKNQCLNGECSRSNYPPIKINQIELGLVSIPHLVTLYITNVPWPSAKNVLKNKGIKIETFSLFTIVSTFATCGYVPTNENMIVFKKNSGLLLLILPHVLLGNTLYPPCLRLFIKVLKSVNKREEFSYLLKNSKEMGYDHLLSSLHCWLLLVTVFGFNVIQFVLFCSMEWSSNIMEDLNLYEKVVATLFQVSNARHSGESVFDLSTISSAILVMFMFVVMM
ncbi:high-affinity potassium transporter [Medicago truncatula]|uniref:High-affinity potassium transporter n=1 Tax=Medicago truncatula TaxID=3880 RepID=A0A072UCC7_MEDTR|nr:high-affinity potassium transporter [Medicago truncatula]